MFDKHRDVEEHKFHVFDRDCRYDVILGRRFSSEDWNESVVSDIGD